MKTIRYTQKEYKQVAKSFNDGHIIGIPTDTVYGLGVIANNNDAIKRLKEIKKRPDDKPFAYMVDHLEKIEAVCKLTDRDRRLINQLLPGPFTLIFNKKENKRIVNESNLKTLAIRIPKHPFILECIKELDVGLYVPSANISSFTPAITSDEVLEVFDQKIEGVVIGKAYDGLPSTIIDCTKEELICLREGAVPFKNIIQGEIE